MSRPLRAHPPGALAIILGLAGLWLTPQNVVIAVCRLGQLLAVDGESYGQFGRAVGGGQRLVAAFRGTVTEGQRASVDVFEPSLTGWRFAARVVSNDLQGSRGFGLALAVEGHVIAIGAPFDDNEHGVASGSVFVFRRTDGAWVQEAALTAHDGHPNHFFGESVAVSGDVVVVGAPRDQGGPGAVYIFERIGDEWRETAKLTVTDGWGIAELGNSVSVSGYTALAGAHWDDDQGNYSGSAYVFERDAGGTWKQTAKLLAEDGRPMAAFGGSVSISGDWALIGATLAGGLDRYSGAAYVFRRQADGRWRQQAKLFSDTTSGADAFGYAVALDEATALIGAPGYDNRATSDGAAFVFQRQADGTWRQTAHLSAFDGRASDQFGWAVALRDGVAIVGAPFTDTLGTDSGAAYVFGLGPDDNGNGTPDPCECPADLDGDYDVDLTDVVLLLIAMDRGSGGDVDGDGDTDLSDLGQMLAQYGRICPEP